MDLLLNCNIFRDTFSISQCVIINYSSKPWSLYDFMFMF